MLVPIIAGSDKTTVSVATGHQEYHPLYISTGNITNTMRRSHAVGMEPVALLPIPKSKLIRIFVSFLSQPFFFQLAKNTANNFIIKHSADNFITRVWKKYFQFFAHL
jgi:hypothetical protein